MMKRLLSILLAAVLCIGAAALPAAAEDVTGPDPAAQEEPAQPTPEPVQEPATEPAEPEQPQTPPFSPYAAPDRKDYKDTGVDFWVIQDDWEASLAGQYYIWSRCESVDDYGHMPAFNRAFRQFYADDPLLAIDNHIVYVKKLSKDRRGRPTGDPYYAVLDFFDSDETEAKTTKLRIPAAVNSIPVKTVFMWRNNWEGGARYNGYSNDTVKSVVIDAPMSGLAPFAFSHFTALQKITLPETVTVVGESAFEACAALRRVTARGEITQLADYAFSGCASLDYRMPASLQRIGSCAFRDSGITKADIPLSAGFVSTDYEEPEVYGPFMNCKALKTLRFVGEDKQSAAYYSLPENLCLGCTALETVTLPKAKDIRLPAYAFYGCKSLKTVKNMNSVGWIDAAAFQNCAGLQKLTLPASVKFVQAGAFAGCKKLRSLTLESNDPAILDDYTFDEIPGYQGAPLPGNFIKDLPKACTVYVGSKDMKYAVKAHDFKGTVKIRVKVAAPKTAKFTKKNGQVTFKWSKVTKADGYRIWSYNPKTGKYTKLATVKAPKTGISLKSGAGQFIIRAYRIEAGDVSWSAIKAFK